MVAKAKGRMAPLDLDKVLKVKILKTKPDPMFKEITAGLQAKIKDLATKTSWGSCCVQGCCVSWCCIQLH